MPDCAVRSPSRVRRIVIGPARSSGVTPGYTGNAMSFLSLPAMAPCSTLCDVQLSRARLPDRCRAEGFLAAPGEVGQVLRVLADEAEPVGAAGVLPRQPDEVQAGDV